MLIRTRTLPVALFAAVLCAPVFAATPQTTPATATTHTSQQQKMADCSHQNKGKTGADYKAAQKACLSGQSTAATSTGKTTQQQKMANCSHQGKGKKGNDYKMAMSACLKS